MEQNTSSPIDGEFVEYINAIARGDNPDNLHAVVCIYDDQEPRMFHRPDASAGNLAYRTPIENPPRELWRTDTVTSIVYSSNPICRWVMINGRLCLICT